MKVEALQYGLQLVKVLCFSQGRMTKNVLLCLMIYFSHLTTPNNSKN